MKHLIAQPLETCPHCGCDEFFIRKDFPQKLGMTVVILAGISFLVLAANPRTFYIGAYILAGCVVIDLVLYFVVRRITVCYRCRSEFIGPLNPKHEGYELATGEKYRQMKIMEERKE